MSKQLILSLAAGAVLVVAVETAHAQKTQSFNSASSAAAAGWVATGSGVDSQVGGFINTNDAGGAPGEAQFDAFRGVTFSYVDTNLGMTINGNTAGGFSITGKLNYLGGTGATPDLGTVPILGFSSSPRDYIGIMFRGDFEDLGLDLAWGLRFETTGDDIRINSGGDFSRILTPNVPRTFSLVYDPSAGTYGSVTASVSGAGSTITHFLSETNRDLLNSASYNAAGFIKRVAGADPEHGVFFRMDDLAYTGVPVVVPEPDGDYNKDGVVDAADYVAWRKSPGDFNGDPDGYNDWVDFFGESAGSGGGSSSGIVPEPGVGAAMLIALLSAAATRSRKSSQVGSRGRS